MNVKLFVGLLLVAGGFLSLYSAVALSFVPSFVEYVFLLILWAVILIVPDMWLINPLGIWGD
jgi:divalent metal cation (Fe/Co/Zn/Cd) transporter